MMTKDEIIRLFKSYGYLFRQLNNENTYEVSTRTLNFGYDGEIVSIDNVSLVIFGKDNTVWFNENLKYDMGKMDEYHFMFSTQPSLTRHPMCKAYDRASMIVKAFGMEF